MDRTTINKRLLFSSLLALMLGTFSTACADLVFEFDFDDGFQGWSTPDTSTFWRSNGGNPNGYVQKRDFENNTVDDGFIYAPSSILGDWSSYDNVGTISYDHRLQFVGDLGNFVPYELRLIGPSDSAIWRGSTPSGVTDWLTVDAALIENEWNVTGDWNQLLGNITEFRVKTEVVSNVNVGERVGVDNIRLTAVPESSSFPILAGLAGLILYVRFRVK